ncbi:MAG: response regulator [Legionellales bacterium]|nr:response regulator [Legionellales bacterium]
MVNEPENSINIDSVEAELQDWKSILDAEIRAQRILEFFPKLVERSDDIFWVRTPDLLQQIYVSPAFEKIFQEKCADLYQNPAILAEKILPEDAEKMFNQQVEKFIPQHFQRNERFTNDYRICLKDGEIRWLRDYSFPIQNDAGKCLAIAGICRDVTEEKLREHELQEARMRAEAANIAKAEFLATMSHELRTPLNIILGMADLLSNDEITPEQQLRAKHIYRAGKNLLTLINDVLDFSRLEAGRIQFENSQFDVSGLIEDLIESFQEAKTSEHLELSAELDPGLPKLVYGDENRVRQIIINLLSNALKFTEQGFVKIRARAENCNENSVTVVFEVIDSGIGIPEISQDTIFERFHKLDQKLQKRYNGAGLGLAITKQLVEKMQGTISVTSQVHVGSTFSVRLPFALNPIRQRFGQPENLMAKIPLNLRILLVEDDVLNQEIMLSLLKPCQAKIDFALTGELALEMLKNPYDLILLDIDLPGISGLEVCKRFRNLQVAHREIPVIAVTAHILPDDRELYREAGINEIVAKPIIKENLFMTILHCVTNIN